MAQYHQGSQDKEEMGGEAVRDIAVPKPIQSFSSVKRQRPEPAIYDTQEQPGEEAAECCE